MTDLSCHHQTWHFKISKEWSDDGSAKCLTWQIDAIKYSSARSYEGSVKCLTCHHQTWNFHALKYPSALAQLILDSVFKLPFQLKIAQRAHQDHKTYNVQKSHEAQLAQKAQMTQEAQMAQKAQMAQNAKEAKMALTAQEAQKAKICMRLNRLRRLKRLRLRSPKRLK